MSDFMKKLRSDFCLFILLISTPTIFCSPDSLQKDRSDFKKNSSKIKTDTVAGVLLDSSIAVLKNLPPPRYIALPAAAGHSYNNSIEEGGENIKLYPASITKAKAPLAHFKNFNTEEGLPLPGIYCSWRDRKNRLWFGTSGGGVSCYDGVKFINYDKNNGLVNGIIRSIGEDDKGALWFGSIGFGVSKFDGVKFTTYTTDDGLADNKVFSIRADHKGRIWFGTFQGVSRYDGKSFTTIDTADGLPSNNVNMVSVDREGDLWFATIGGGACRYDGKNLTTYNTDSGLSSNIVTCVFEDSKGRHWIGTYGGGVNRFDGKEFVNYTTQNGLVDDVIVDIEEDNSGRLWFASDGGGVGSFDGARFESFTVNEGLSNNGVRSVTRDQFNNLWFATNGGGVSKYLGKSFQQFTPKQGIPESIIWSITEDQKGNLWFGTNGDGVYSFDGKEFKQYTVHQGLHDNTINGIAQDSLGNMWFISFNNGLCKFDGNGFTTYTTRNGLPQNNLSSITVDHRGNLWVGSMEGHLSRFDGSRFINYNTPAEFSENNIVCIKEDSKANIWLGFDGRGASRFDGKKWYHYDRQQGLHTNAVADIEEDRKGNLWFASGGDGVFRFDGISFTAISTDDGLADNMVYGMVEDSKGVLWIGTNKGFSGLKFNTPFKGNEKETTVGAGFLAVNNDTLKSLEPVWEYFNSSTNYPIKDINEGGVYIKKKNLPYGNIADAGTIWASSGDNKLICLSPDLVEKNNAALDVFIRIVKIDESVINWYALNKKMSDTSISEQHEFGVYGKKLTKVARDSLMEKFSDLEFDNIQPFYDVPQNLVVPYNHNQVSFEYGAIETNSSKLVKYRYLLEGYDDDWSPPTDKTSVTFGNIAEGKYKFLLAASGTDHNWSIPVAYYFTVKPPWWRTWWAYCCYIILLISAVYAMIRFRTLAIKKENLVLEQKVAVRTHELSEAKDHIEHSLEKLKATQAQLIQSEKMASLGELTAGIAHEIQNPLNFVNNFSDVNKELTIELEEELDKGNLEDARDIIKDIRGNEEKINHHGKRADAIVKNMLQHSHAGGGVRELTNINALADEYLRLAYHGVRAKDKSFNVALITKFDESIGNISMVAQDISRVLLNLYNNALYAAAEKKKGKADFSPEVSVITRKNNDTVEITVMDNGNGIPETIVNKIFQPFFTTKPTGEGTGLGLSLSYDIVKAHGGEIRLETKEGDGSKFIVSLPLA
jgi:signal transduction histidine kinase/ligand-binding sensor domain-containing protein